MIRTLLVFMGIIILCRFAMALSIRNRAYISYIKDCQVKYVRKNEAHNDHLFNEKDPWMQRKKMNNISRSPNLNKDYEEISKLSYDYDYVIK